jgi:hypothetical protein
VCVCVCVCVCARARERVIAVKNTVSKPCVCEHCIKITNFYDSGRVGCDTGWIATMARKLFSPSGGLFTHRRSVTSHKTEIPSYTTVETSQSNKNPFSLQHAEDYTRFSRGMMGRLTYVEDAC